MPRIPRRKLAEAVKRLEEADGTHEKGRALEDFFCFFFSLIPGVEIAQRNQLNEFLTEEVDVALWNSRHRMGFDFLPNILLVECKNWSKPCGSQEVAYFVSLLRQRGCEYGILFVASGITGTPQELTAAKYQIASALRDGIRVIVVTTDDVTSVVTTQEFVTAIKKKLCQLTVSGTAFA